ncbi:porin [Sorangium cellulosum]|uniref:Porin n=1 Tax=Sorangium cellulosum TaxID=56 RepID=A0A150T1X3_SORCE|nr:porin [Sorangium cellulosum]
MRSRSFCSLAAALAALAAAPARAQDAPVKPDGMALSRFVPAPAGDRMFSVPSPFAPGHLTPHVMLMADYASNPLVLRRARDGAEIGAVVSDQLTFRLNASLPLWNKVSFDLDAPLTALQSGENPNGGGREFASPSGAELGDLRLGARVQLYGTYHDPLQLAVGAYLWLPTGAADSFVSDGHVRAMPYLAAGGRLDRLVWSSSLGTELRRSQSFGGVAQGTMLTLGGGVGFLALGDRLQVGPELTTAMVLEDISSRSINAELLLDARYRFLPFLEAGVGVGPGLTSGIGTPDLRVVAMAAFTPEQPPDGDRDGIPDPEDACPKVAGERSADPRKHGCPPPPDRDNDGIPDGEDACPFVAGVASADPRKHGCPPPPDRDNDGIPDGEDACPFVAGVASADPRKHGCPPPPDRDNDGIPDGEDACPFVAGVASADPRKHGCPPPPDRDNDGIPDGEDACPFVAGVASADPRKHGCPPPPDRDNDGIPDGEDACPIVAGVASDDPRKNGCPPDQDEDGVPDSEDACPEVKGLRSKDPAKNGCPRDTDGDEIRDDKDACPREKGFADPDPEKHGCPKAVRVTDKNVVILQQVQFDTDKATIKPVSDPLLDEVAQVLKEHPEIVLIEIQGHTDDRGTDEHNRVLSQNRANSVMAALVRRGIDSTRLTAQGYGRDQPLDNNATEEGRQRNRRVQFIIIKKAAYKPQVETGEDR